MLNFSIRAVVISFIIIAFWIFDIELLIKPVEFYLRYLSIFIIISYYLNRPVKNPEIAALQNIIIVWCIVFILLAWFFGVRLRFEIYIIISIFPLIYFFRKIPKLRTAIGLIVTLCYLIMINFFGGIECSNYSENQNITEIDNHYLLIAKYSSTFTNSYISCAFARKIMGKYIYIVIERGSLKGKIEYLHVTKNNSKKTITVKEGQDKIVLTY